MSSEPTSLTAIRGARPRRRLDSRGRGRAHRLQDLAVAPGSRPRCLVGLSDACRRMLELVLRVAPEERHVLLLGETGTGKKLVAESIHALSRRAKEPLVTVYCTGLDERHFESELFGRPKGSLSDDDKAPGKVAQARGGTLLFDDVGDLGLPQQGELLRLLRLYVPGRWSEASATSARSGRPAPGPRLICTAHPSILDRVVKGRFSRDLYYRLSAFPIELPPLRERQGDLPVLVEQLFHELAPGRRIRLADETLAVLESYPFPGNFLELRSVVEHACLAADGDLVLPCHLPEDVRRPAVAGARTDGENVTYLAGSDTRGRSRRPPRTA